jgi:hypothetical protein
VRGKGEALLGLAAFVSKSYDSLFFNFLGTDRKWVFFDFKMAAH